MTPRDEFWMRHALNLAKAGELRGEVPVGAVIVDSSGELLAEGSNAPIELNDPTAHAEIIALRAAAAKLGTYRLEGTTLYCTLEPCPMCAGALVNSRIARLVFGARDLRFGGVRSKFQIADSGLLNHSVEISEGILGPECTEILVEFFKMRR
ncbi:MAG: tRNA adenosine(34) deaminase TadA [Acidobacteria bacterium]|nr:tRNA adenosine(34) deaminase TadA [Acidobacteriota bacterium]